uniref:interferon a3-like n=1 Tax=Scatophagus argus TaxID=75038 RepID=UPI001ED85B79|nr:interferon a3-like [Scatophagus argus]
MRLGSLFSVASSLSCRWMDHKFKEYSESCLDLLSVMGNNSTNSTEDAEVQDAVAFPDDLYNQASQASAEGKLAFAVQVLDETAGLFEEDHSSASWEENTADDFVNVLTKQADELRSCVSISADWNKKLHMYFKRLSSLVKRMDHSADVWEVVRKQIKSHLMSTDLLVSSLLPTN